VLTDQEFSPPERVSPPSLALSSTRPVLSSPRSGSTASCSLPPPLHYPATAIGESPGGPLSRPGRGSAPPLPRMGLATSGANPDWYPWPPGCRRGSSTTSGRCSAQPGTRQSPTPPVLVQPPHGGSPGSLVPVDPVSSVDNSLVRSLQLSRWIY
jgi:hypothetical protein